MRRFVFNTGPLTAATCAQHTWDSQGHRSAGAPSFVATRMGVLAHLRPQNVTRFRHKNVRQAAARAALSRFVGDYRGIGVDGWTRLPGLTGLPG